MEPVISVIVPIYKVEAYLPACVESILAQSYQNFELVLVDDGSPDGCPALCDAYAAQDSRVRVIHRKNGGLSAARNAGLDIARGAYIYFCDSDDYLHPDCLSALYGLIVQTKSDIAQGCYISAEPASAQDFSPLDLSNCPCYSGHEMCSFLPPRDKVLRDAGAPCNKLYSAPLFADIRFPVGRVYEDTATIYRLLWAAKQVACTERAYYYRSARPGSITNSPISFARMDQITALQERADFFAARKEPQLQAYALAEICNYACEVGVAAQKAGETAVARAMFQASKATYPQAVRCKELGIKNRCKLWAKFHFPRSWETLRRLLTEKE